MWKHKASILMFLIQLVIFVNTRSVEAHEITIPSNVYFHLWQQSTYINFASTTSVEYVLQTNDKLYLGQYWFSIENANLTILNFFIDYQLILAVNAPSQNTSITRVYVNNWGEPTSVHATNGTLTWSYDSQTRILTLTVIHSNRGEITVDWRITGDIDRDGDVDSDDLHMFADAYGLNVGEPSHNPEADMDYDGDIDIGDLYLLARNYG